MPPMTTTNTSCLMSFVFAKMSGTLLFFSFCGGLLFAPLFPRRTVMHFYSSLSSIFSLLGIGDPAVRSGYL
jgi:hypothetical protein